MKVLVRVMGQTFGSVIALFYGRADRWWAWSTVIVVWLGLHTLFAQRMDIGLSDYLAKNWDGLLEFFSISAFATWIRIRFFHA